jgi:hypothetical protein
MFIKITNIETGDSNTYPVNETNLKMIEFLSKEDFIIEFV